METFSTVDHFEIGPSKVPSNFSCFDWSDSPEFNWGFVEINCSITKKKKKKAIKTVKFN